MAPWMPTLREKRQSTQSQYKVLITSITISMVLSWRIHEKSWKNQPTIEVLEDRESDSDEPIITQVIEKSKNTVKREKGEPLVKGEVEVGTSKPSATGETIAMRPTAKNRASLHEGKLMIPNVIYDRVVRDMMGGEHTATHRFVVSEVTIEKTEAAISLANCASAAVDDRQRMAADHQKALDQLKADHQALPHQLHQQAADYQKRIRELTANTVNNDKPNATNPQVIPEELTKEEVKEDLVEPNDKQNDQHGSMESGSQACKRPRNIRSVDRDDEPKRGRSRGTSRLRGRH
jgi:hypothetical protein